MTPGGNDIMRASDKRNPVPGFAPSRIETVTELDVVSIEAIRIAEPSTYHINSDAAQQGVMPAGVTVIASDVARITFAEPTTVEIMLP